MKIELGTYRVVLVFKKFVIKFPRIYLFNALRLAWQQARKGRLYRQWHYRYQQYSSVKFFLVKGIMDNWHEYIYYRRWKLAILAPTYYSFFGLFNFQAKTEKLPIKSKDLFIQLHDLTNGEVYVDAHEFHDARNFGTIIGQFRIHDYADKKIHHVLRRYGRRMIKKFDIGTESKDLPKTVNKWRKRTWRIQMK